MLQDKYGRLIIVGVFVVIGVILLLAPGLNSKNKSVENDQLNFTSMPKEVEKISEIKTDNQVNSLQVTNESSAEHNSSSAEEDIFDAWGIRNTSTVRNEQAISNETLKVEESAILSSDTVADEYVKKTIERNSKQQVQKPSEVEKPKKSIIKVNGKCFAPPKVHLPMLSTECANTSNKFGIQACLEDSTKKDGWGGTVRACGGIEKMPDMDDLLAISRILYANDSIRIAESARSQYKAFGTYSPEERVCDSFEIKNLFYNPKIASELGFPQHDGYEIWGKTEISPKYALSLFFGQKFITYNSCSNRDVTMTYALCQIPCEE